MGKTHVNISIEIENVYFWFEKLTSGDTQAHYCHTLAISVDLDCHLSDIEGAGVLSPMAKLRGCKVISM